MLGNFTKISKLKYGGVDLLSLSIWQIPFHYTKLSCLLRKYSKQRVTLKNLVYPITCYELKLQVSWIPRTL